MKKFIPLLFIALGALTITQLNAETITSPDWVIVKDNATGETNVAWDGDDDCITILVVEDDGSFETDFVGDC